MMIMDVAGIGLEKSQNNFCWTTKKSVMNLLKLHAFSNIFAESWRIIMPCCKEDIFVHQILIKKSSMHFRIASNKCQYHIVSAIIIEHFF